MRRTLALAGVLVVVALVASSAALAGGGNSANAKLCQKNGWMNLYRSDGTTFTSEQECVSYGAMGFEILQTNPFVNGRAACAALEGTFSTDPNDDLQNTVPGDPEFAWACNYYITLDLNELQDAQNLLNAACIADGQVIVSSGWPALAPIGTTHATCFAEDIVYSS